MATPLLPNPNENSTPFDSGYLKVSELHSIYYEQHGNRDGKPVVYLHGGPGARATRTSSLLYFDLSAWRVVLFDQRGAGRSQPPGELRDNTSQLLVQDIETLRAALGVRKWHAVFGGSWGSTLALLYAQTHPAAVASLVLRGVLLATDAELGWFYSAAAPGVPGLETLFPDVSARWLGYLADVGEDPATPVASYHRLLTHADPDVVRAAAREWTRYELELMYLRPRPEEVAAALADDDFLLSFARIEAAYYVHRAWLREGQLLEPEAVARISHIPTSIVHGRYDVICQPRSAWRLYQALGGEDGRCELFYTIAGHDRTEVETAQKLIEICKRYGEMDFE